MCQHERSRSQKRSRSGMIRNWEVSGEFLNPGELVSTLKNPVTCLGKRSSSSRNSRRRRTTSLPISDSRLSQCSTGVIVSPLIFTRPRSHRAFRGKTCRSKRFFVKCWILPFQRFSFSTVSRISGSVALSEDSHWIRQYQDKLYSE